MQPDMSKTYVAAIHLPIVSDLRWFPVRFGLDTLPRVS